MAVARSLAGDLAARDDVEAVELCADLDVMGRRFGRFLTSGFERHLGGPSWSYELAYRVFFERALPRGAAHLALAALGSRGLRQRIAEFGADVVVAEYPVLSAALGQLRLLGRLTTPVCSSISDPAGLYYWAHPGIDMHLLSWPESMAEVDRIAGPGRATVVRPPLGRGLLEPPSRPEARATLGLPLTAPVILVSGGGWGLGDLAGAAEITLITDSHAIAVLLAGRNLELQRRLDLAYADNPRVRVLGFTERMPELLAAADAIVHTTGGTTALEARVAGCRLINYGRGIAHVRAHARAMEELGIAEWAQDRTELGPALARALERGRPARLEIDALPPAADVVLRVGRARSITKRSAVPSAAPPHSDR